MRHAVLLSIIKCSPCGVCSQAKYKSERLSFVLLKFSGMVTVPLKRFLTCASFEPVAEILWLWLSNFLLKQLKISRRVLFRMLNTGCSGSDFISELWGNEAVGESSQCEPFDTLRFFQSILESRIVLIFSSANGKSGERGLASHHRGRTKVKHGAVGQWTWRCNGYQSADQCFGLCDRFRPRVWLFRMRLEKWALHFVHG